MTKATKNWAAKIKRAETELAKANKDWAAKIKRSETDLERLKLEQQIAALDEKLAILGCQHPSTKLNS